MKEAEKVFVTVLITAMIVSIFLAPAISIEFMKFIVASFIALLVFAMGVCVYRVIEVLVDPKWEEEEDDA